MVFAPPRPKRLSVKGLFLSESQHFISQSRAKGFTTERILDCFNFPTKVYPSGSHKGQIRVINGDVCLVGRIDGDTFVAITVYLDGVVTEVRPDQMNTPQGMAFAKYGRSR